MANRRSAILILATCLAGQSATASVVAYRAPWTVRVVVRADEPICPEAAVSLRLRGDARKLMGSLTVPLVGGNVIDRDWDVDRAPEGQHALIAELTSCSGLRLESAQLDLETIPQELRREVYVAVDFLSGRPALRYLEAAALFDATSILSVSESPDGVIVTNTSTTSVASSCASSKRRSDMALNCALVCVTVLASGPRQDGLKLSRERRPTE